MKDIKEVFLLFYGIYWGIIISKIGQYRLFDTHIWRRPHFYWRLPFGLIFVNIIPIGWFWFLYNYIAPDLSDNSGKIELLPLLSTMFATFSLFGIYRIIHAIVATEKYRDKFYDKTEDKKILENLEERYNPNTFADHFYPGLYYLFACTALACVLGGKCFKIIKFIFLLICNGCSC